MKKLNLYALISLVFLFTLSCKKDTIPDPDPPEEEHVIVGKWNIDILSARVFVGDEEVTEPLILENQGFLEFKKDKTGNGNDDYTFTWSLTDDALVLVFQDDVDNDLLRVISGISAKLVVINDNSVEIEYNSIEQNIDGVDAIVKVKFELSRI